MQIGTVGLLCQFCQTIVEHADAGIFQVVNNQILHIALHLVGNRITLKHQLHDAILHLLVFIDHKNSLLIVGHGFSHHRGRILGHLDRSKEVLDFLLHLIYVNITHYYDGLIIWTVPFFIVSTQHLGLEVIDDFHQTDRHAVAVF